MALAEDMTKDAPGPDVSEPVISVRDVSVAFSTGQKVLENLVALSRLERDRRRQRNIRLPEVVAEVFRQLRELARARQELDALHHARSAPHPRIEHPHLDQRVRVEVQHVAALLSDAEVVEQ